MTQGDPRVLLVDDDPDTVGLYSLALRGSGLVVDVATTGAAALASARQAPPAVVVTDLNLPDVDGADLCASLRAESGDRLLGLIVLSGSSGVEVQDRARRAGATAVLTKPCLPTELERAIREALAASAG